PSKFYTNCPGKHEVFVRLLYSIAFMHCVIQERRKFGTFGWNVPYGFNSNDFLITVNELQHIINNRESPLEEVVYLTEKCSYGGHISDERDSRLFQVVVEDYLNANNTEAFLNYRSPLKTDYQD